MNECIHFVYHLKLFYEVLNKMSFILDSIQIHYFAELMITENFALRTTYPKHD